MSRSHLRNIASALYGKTGTEMRLLNTSTDMFSETSYPESQRCARMFARNLHATAQDTPAFLSFEAQAARYSVAFSSKISTKWCSVFGWRLTYSTHRSYWLLGCKPGRCNSRSSSLASASHFTRCIGSLGFRGQRLLDPLGSLPKIVSIRTQQLL